MAQIITLASTKGGVGKTSLAVNIAGIAATEHNLNVLLVDADENQGAWSWFDPQERPIEIARTSSSSDALTKLRRLTRFDLIIVDLPGFRGKSLLNMINSSSSDLVVTPSRPNPLDMSPLLKVIPAINTQHRVVFTMTTPGRDPDEASYRQTFSQKGWNIAQTRIRLSKGWSRAAQHEGLVTNERLYPSAKVDARALTTELLEVVA